MRLKMLLAVGWCILLIASPAYAWKQETHRRIVLDAVMFMKNNPDKTNYAKLLAGITRGGYSLPQFAAAMGQAAYDVDDFADTYICGRTSGDCQFAPIWSAAAGIVKYTTFWHFQNHTAGPDIHGNPFGGYNFSKILFHGDVDNLTVTWLLGDYLDDGPGGMRGLFGDKSRFDTYGMTEAHYRHFGVSTPAMYSRFESMPFQPLDNLGQFWWQQFLGRPSAQTLGFALHATDLVQPHHTWMTSGNHHAGWEKWVLDYYDNERLNDPRLIEVALGDFTPVPLNSIDIRPLLTQGGTWSYRYGGIVLTSTDHSDRVTVGRMMIPHAIAMVVHVLNRAAERMVI